MNEPSPFLDTSPAKRKIPAWAMSMLLHVVLVLLLVTVLDDRRGGQGDAPDRSVGVAVAHRMSDRTEYETPEGEGPVGETQSAESAEVSEEAMAAASAPPALAQPLDVRGLLAEATSTPTPDAIGGRGNSIEAASSDGSGSANLGAGGSPPASTMFFGLSGSGRRFVYVFDRSESMNNHDKRPLRAAKSEIVRSLNQLGPEQTFQIVFYNNRSNFFKPVGQSFWLLPADESMKRRAEAFVRSIDGRGGTQHFEALKMALQLEPDVIFFLTDARIPQLGRRDLDEIRARASRSKTTIHAIEFGEDVIPPRDSFLETLAAENQGQYRYFNVNQLQVAPGTPQP